MNKWSEEARRQRIRKKLRRLDRNSAFDHGPASEKYGDPEKRAKEAELHRDLAFRGGGTMRFSISNKQALAICKRQKRPAVTLPQVKFLAAAER
jgi:hypothetical protein